MEGNSGTQYEKFDSLEKMAHIKRPLKYKLLIFHFKLIQLFKRLWIMIIQLISYAFPLGGVIMGMIYLYSFFSNIIHPGKQNANLFIDLLMIFLSICLFYLGWSLFEITLNHHFKEVINLDEFQQANKEYHLKESLKSKFQQK